MKRQAGSLLLELSLVLLFVMVSVVWAGQTISRKIDDGMADATAVWMLSIKGAVDQLLSRHFLVYADGASLLDKNQQAIFKNQYAPTLDELKAHGFLAPNFPTKNPFGSSARVSISRDAMRCPGSACRIDGLVYTDSPIQRVNSEFADLDLVSQVIYGLQGYGGASWLSDSQSLRGASFKLPNPLPDKVGIVAALSGFDAARYHEFVRVGDHRDPALQGQLSIQAELTAKRLSVREVAVPNTVCSNSVFSGSKLALNTQTELARTSEGGLVACIAGKWRVVASVAEEGQSCGSSSYPEGATAVSASGITLLCRQGSWRKLIETLSPSKVAVMGVYRAPPQSSNLNSSMTIPKPSCPGGTPFAYLSVQRSLSNYASSYRGFSLGTPSLPGETSDRWGIGPTDAALYDNGTRGWVASTISGVSVLVITNCFFP